MKAAYPPEQPPVHSAWYDFKYVRRQSDTIDSSLTAERIRRLYESPDLGKVSRLITFDIETGVEMMMLCAGMSPAREVPYHIQYLAAHQYVQDFHAGLKFATHEAIARLFGVSRASTIVSDALDRWEKGDGS
ncbi:MAG: hypothetical protein ABW208_08855 [Pyrinomonadaceae bacterium]